jgi:ferredoxin
VRNPTRCPRAAATKELIIGVFCGGCGLCAERCPVGAITMEALEIDESPETGLGLYYEFMDEVRTC